MHVKNTHQEATLLQGYLEIPNVEKQTKKPTISSILRGFII